MSHGHILIRGKGMKSIHGSLFRVVNIFLDALKGANVFRMRISLHHMLQQHSALSLLIRIKLTKESV